MRRGTLMGLGIGQPGSWGRCKNPRMAEIIQKDGTWTFDGDAVRIVPGRDKG